MSFNNRTVVITGGAKGIGAVCADIFLQEGANVAILDLDTGGENNHGGKFLAVQCDVSKAAEVQAAMQKVNDAFGSIYYLINNAGIQRYGSVTSTSEEDWDLVMNTNCKSYFLSSKYALPFMQQSGAGVIINVSSVQAFVTQQNVAAYAASKSALLGLTRSIAIDYAPSIRCIAVCPGTIDTPMLKNALAESADPAAVRKECEEMHLLNRIGTATEVASLIKFLCSDEASFITGEYIRIDGGLGIQIGGSKKESI